MTSQNGLFGANATRIPPEFNGGLVAQVTARATSPLQFEFAKLLESIETSGERAQELERLHGIYRAKFGQILPALQAQQDDLSRQLVLFLHARLQRPDEGSAKSLTASHRKAIGRVIVSISLDFALQGDPKMRAIHDLYSNESIEEMDAASMDSLLNVLDDMGVELPEQGSQASAADVAQAALKAIRQKVLQQEETEAQRKARRDEKRAAKAKADPKAQAKLAQKDHAALEAQGALKNIYRQLARQLHPDRATDDSQRALHHELMSETNIAYERQDLLALLKLQLKAQQIDATAMSTVAEDKLKSWIALLRVQAKDLANECITLEMQMSHEFRVPRQRGLTAENLENSLTTAVQDYDAVLHGMRSDLDTVKNDADLKRWAKARSKDLEQHDAMMDGDFLDTMLMQRTLNKMPPRNTKKKR